MLSSSATKAHPRSPLISSSIHRLKVVSCRVLSPGVMDRHALYVPDEKNALWEKVRMRRKKSFVSIDLRT